MKKIIAVVLALVLVLSCFAACGSKPETTSDQDTQTQANANTKTVDSIKKAGKLVMATSPDFPPFEELKEDNNVEGIEVDLLNMICDKLGVELEIAQMDFDSVLPGVQAGKYDVGVSGITVNEKRQKNVLFTDPYCLAAQAIVVTKDSDIKSKADLDGKKVSVQTGTTAETYTMENGYDVSSFQANTDAQSALVTNKVDAWVIDDLTAVEMVKKYNSEKGSDELVILSDVMTTEPYALAFSFGSEELVAEINNILNGLVKDGTVASIFEKYEAPYTSPLAE